LLFPPEQQRQSSVRRRLPPGLAFNLSVFFENLHLMSYPNYTVHWKEILLGSGYFAFFMISVGAMLLWQKRYRKRRKPFPDDFRLLRAPGETQLNWIRSFDENAFLYVMVAGAVPVGVASVLLLLIQRLAGVWVLGGLVVGLVVFSGAYIGAARWLTGRMAESWDRYLGYFGERYVAEWLEPLRERGWRVFHDVPCVAHGKKFNIDHVAVGPGGVFVIETKTRRKGAARHGCKDNEVFFDGQVLDWPWGEDNHGLEQAERNAVWLADTLKAETGERAQVYPILTLPGWWVQEVKPMKNPRLARVANPKWLPKWLSGAPVILNEKQVAAIASKLEERCRDVKYGA
jgi:hypothetical protein